MLIRKINFESFLVKVDFTPLIEIFFFDNIASDITS